MYVWEFLGLLGIDRIEVVRIDLIGWIRSSESNEFVVDSDLLGYIGWVYSIVNVCRNF